MKGKFLVSVLLSLGIVVVGVGVAYAAYTFHANQEGFRQAGEGQAARLTMTVEAGMADANSDLVPDDYLSPTTSPGGALSFSIKNANNVPLRVISIQPATSSCGTGIFCPIVYSNKNGSGTYTNATDPLSGDCKQYVVFVAPINFNSWPTIAPRSTLQVNGTDNNRLGAGMIHLTSATAQGCQGALFSLKLIVDAVEWTRGANDPIAP